MPNKPFSYLTTSEDFRNVCHLLSKESALACDTEFVRERTYWPEISLVQLATKKEIFIFDMRAGCDAAPLLSLLKEPSILKIFHAPRQDVEAFYPLINAPITPVFDTQIAAQFSGFGEQVGYADLVEKICGVSLDKSHQYTAWGKRPLEDTQIAYAARDVEFLFEIKDVLEDALQKQGRMRHVLEECALLEEDSLYNITDETAWLRFGLPKDPKSFSVLKTLSAWREREAKAANKPRGHILKDEGLKALAEKRPESLSALEKIRFSEKYIPQAKRPLLLSLIEEALSNPHPYPEKKPLTRGQSLKLDFLKLLLKAEAERLQLPPKLICDSEELESLARGNLDSHSRLYTTWRKKDFLEVVEAALRGETSLRLQGEAILRT